jgi:hypothetical protein
MIVWILMFTLNTASIEIYAVYDNEQQCRIMAEIIKDNVDGRVECLDIRLHAMNRATTDSSTANNTVITDH